MDATAHYAGLPSDVPEARRFVRQELEDSADPDDLDALLVLVSEVVTRTVVHSHADFFVLLRWDGAVARVEIHEGSTRAPELVRIAPDDANAARGMQVLAALATRWGVEGEDDGRFTWFEAAVAKRGE